MNRTRAKRVRAKETAMTKTLEDLRSEARQHIANILIRQFDGMTVQQSEALFDAAILQGMTVTFGFGDTDGRLTLAL